MREFETIYYSYKNKDEVFYLTTSEEELLLESKNQFIKTLSEDQIKFFSKHEIKFHNYKEALIKEIIHYSITFHE